MWDFPGIQPAAGDGIDDAKISSAPASFRFAAMPGLLEPTTGPPPTAAANYLAHRAEEGGGEWMAASPRGSLSEQHGVAGEAAGAPRVAELPQVLVVVAELGVVRPCLRFSLS
jgi:hypothetical protein